MQKKKKNKVNSRNLKLKWKHIALNKYIFMKSFWIPTFLILCFYGCVLRNQLR